MLSFFSVVWVWFGHGSGWSGAVGFCCDVHHTHGQLNGARRVVAVPREARKQTTTYYVRLV